MAEKSATTSPKTRRAQQVNEQGGDFLGLKEGIVEWGLPEWLGGVEESKALFLKPPSPAKLHTVEETQAQEIALRRTPR